MVNATGVVDSTLPTYTLFQNNASVTATGTGSKVNVSLIASDNVQLDYYVCANNQSGTLTNETPIDISGTSFPISHIITVTQPAGSNISYNCWMNDTSGNTNTTYIDYFKVESTAPVISSVAASSITNTGATITWTTNEIANTTINYGTTSGSLTSTSETDDSTLSHSRVLIGLTKGTLYYYTVTSCDPIGNCVTSLESSFTADHTVRSDLYQFMTIAGLMSILVIGIILISILMMFYNKNDGFKEKAKELPSLLTQGMLTLLVAFIVVILVIVMVAIVVRIV